MSVDRAKAEIVDTFRTASAMVISIPISLAGSIPMQTDATFSANSFVLSMAVAVLAGIEQLCKILKYKIYSEQWFCLLTNLLVQLLLATDKLCAAMTWRRDR